uniref:Uncharacterized protein n=1 Tax=Angiostrongylus cantonensis TaxID=6313 RepID=A0A0K0CZ25_ANGCA
MAALDATSTERLLKFQSHSWLPKSRMAKVIIYAYKARIHASASDWLRQEDATDSTPSTTPEDYCSEHATVEESPALAFS